jgi:hypothetical protein
MTEPPAPLFVSPPAGQLRQVEHPDLSALLTHFCARARPRGPAVAPGICAMIAPQRLTSILQSQQLQSFTTYSGGDPAVCFTESTHAGIEFMLARRGYQPWALVFDRQSIYDAGGGPVWYARPEQYTALGMIDPGLRSWAVRLDPGSDWLEEQEWRIVLPARTDGLTPVVPLTTLRLVAIIVGAPAWSGAAHRTATTLAGVSQWGWFYPPLPPGLPRWWWNVSTGKLEPLNPLF